MDRKLYLAIGMLLVLLTAAAVVAVESSNAEDGSPEEKVLIDMGNGKTYWSAPSSGTLDSVLKTAAESAGLTFSSSGNAITVNGTTSVTIGGTLCQWTYYTYDSGWKTTAYNGSSTYDGNYIAIGYYPADVCPTVTPEYKTAWTMIHADSLNSGAITNYDASDIQAELSFTYSDSDTLPACYASPLYANGHVYFLGSDYKGSVKYNHMIGFNLLDNSKDWDITYPVNGYALSTGAIYGGHVYYTSVAGTVYSIPVNGDGSDYQKAYMGSTKTISGKSVVMQGLSSIVYDSGHLFFGSSSGIIYCIDPDLNIVWQYQMAGAVYPSTSISVANGLVYIGACDGCLYILNEATGELKAKNTLYYNESTGGRVSTPAVIGDYIMLSYNDGQGMSCAYWGSAVMKYNSASGALTLVKNLPDLAIQSNYMVISPTGNYVYASADDTLYRLYTTGNYEVVGTVDEIHGGLTLVDNTYFYGTDYDAKGGIVVYNMSGVKVASYTKPTGVDNYSMGSTVIAGKYILAVSDSGAFALSGTLVDGKDKPDPTPPTPTPEPTHDSATVKFLIEDGTGFYVTIEGSGMSVLDALKDAVNTYKYDGCSTFSTSGIVSLLGLGYKSIDGSHYQYWVPYQWDAGTSYWKSATSTLQDLYADENSSVMIYYLVTDGTSTDAPSGLPSKDSLTPLKISDNGTRFLIQSETGAYLVVNGTGTTVVDALVDACSGSSIPLAVDGSKITLFGIAASGDNSWNGYNAKSNAWVLYTDDIASGASGKVFSFLYGTSDSLPSIAVSSIITVDPDNGSSDISNLIYYILAVMIIAILVVFLVYLARYAKTMNMSMYMALKSMMKGGQGKSKVKQNKTKLAIVCLIGFVATFIMFLCSLAIGPSVTLSLPETFSALTSAIGKNGNNLNFNEIIVYESRLPRALAVVAVGIGLSIAGCVYQAIIRNPLVDPYIMGVSSGAGTFAVAAIAANFTFFGLLANNNFTTPILAIIGGLLAFGLTLLIAEKAGGSSTNYVLAGVVIGLVFSAAQTLLLVTSNSEKLSSAISWLFGSFANVSWDTVWIIFFPAMFLALVPLFWAKELNLVLLGEDQAKQMGLDVRKFNRWMLILASILTSVCVAFVGIIGFVGMVIPHLARMLLGGDHRLVLPASIMMGGALMLFADLMAKMLMVPTELPVGAITTIIGVPVFAYLLIKKGRIYNG